MSISDIPDVLRKITTWDLTVVLGGFLACVAPGFLIIFVFDPDLVRQLETFKLVLLSASFTLPLVAFNAFALAGIGPFVGAFRERQREPDRKHIFFWLTTWTFLVLYFSIVVTAFWWPLTPGRFLFLVIVVDLVLAFPIVKAMQFLASDNA